MKETYSMTASPWLRIAPEYITLMYSNLNDPSPNIHYWSTICLKPSGFSPICTFITENPLCVPQYPITSWLSTKHREHNQRRRLELLSFLPNHFVLLWNWNLGQISHFTQDHHSPMGCCHVGLHPRTTMHESVRLHHTWSCSQHEYIYHSKVNKRYLNNKWYFIHYISFCS